MVAARTLSTVRLPYCWDDARRAYPLRRGRGMALTRPAPGQRGGRTAADARAGQLVCFEAVAINPDAEVVTTLSQPA